MDDLRNEELNIEETTTEEDRQGMVEQLTSFAEEEETEDSSGSEIGLIIGLGLAAATAVGGWLYHRHKKRKKKKNQFTPSMEKINGETIIDGNVVIVEEPKEDSGTMEDSEEDKN